MRRQDTTGGESEEVVWVPRDSGGRVGMTTRTTAQGRGRRTGTAGRVRGRDGPSETEYDSLGRVKDEDDTPTEREEGDLP